MSKAWLTRRALLAAPAIALWGPAARSAGGLRVATLDWALLETLLAIGANVVAATELRQFRAVAVTPPVPASVVDIGLRGTPNLETLLFSRPDLICNSNFYLSADPILQRIAPVESHSVYVAGESPYLLAQTVTRDLGDRLGLTEPAARLVEGMDARLEALRLRLAGGAILPGGHPVLPINLGDARHFRVFGSDSMFGEVLRRLGLANAWTGATSYSATAPVGVETLAAMPDARIVLIPPHPADALYGLRRSAFWQALPAVREGRVLILPSVNAFGALPAAGRFAELLAEGLAGERQG